MNIGLYIIYQHLGNSVNSFIPPELTSVKYQKLEDAINIIKQLGRGTLMSKLDIKDAFRLIPVNPKIINY